MFLCVHGPSLVPGRELLGKTDTKTGEVSRACHLVAQVEKQLHIFDGQDCCRKRLLVTERGTRLEGGGREGELGIYIYFKAQL